MSEDKTIAPRREVQIEEHGVTLDTVVGIVGSGVTSGIGAYLGGRLANSHGHDNAPIQDPPPQIELPPGVDLDD